MLSTSYPEMFSSCLLPHEIAGLLATLGVIQNGDPRANVTEHATSRLRGPVGSATPFIKVREQIVALEPAPKPATMVLRDCLEARGVFGAVFCAPATSRKRTRWCV